MKFEFTDETMKRILLGCFALAFWKLGFEPTMLLELVKVVRG